MAILDLDSNHKSPKNENKVENWFPVQGRLEPRTFGMQNKHNTTELSNLVKEKGKNRLTNPVRLNLAPA